MQVEFPEQHWAAISSQAKSLICQLLTKDCSARLSAGEMLAHPWIAAGGPSTALNTPHNLRRQASIKQLEDFASRAMAVDLKCNFRFHFIKQASTMPELILQ